MRPHSLLWPENWLPACQCGAPPLCWATEQSTQAPCAKNVKCQVPFPGICHMFSHTKRDRLTGKCLKGEYQGDCDCRFLYRTLGAGIESRGWLQEKLDRRGVGAP